MSTRSIYFVSFILICGLLLVSVYLQVADGVLPCALCTLQRLTFVLLGVFFLLGALFYRVNQLRWLLNALILVSSVSGMILAGRQIWLQHSPNLQGECGVSLQYMMQILPLNEVMQKIFAGSTECAETGWTFLSLNMAEWSLGWFIFFFVMAIRLMFKNKTVPAGWLR